MKDLEILDQLLNNEKANPYHFFLSGCLNKTKQKAVVSIATLDQLKEIIIKFDDHQLFDFLEGFILDGGTDVMGEDEYWEFIEVSGLYGEAT